MDTTTNTCTPWTLGLRPISAQLISTGSAFAFATDALMRMDFPSVQMDVPGVRMDVPGVQLWAGNIDAPNVGAVANGSYKAVQAATGTRPRGTPL